MNTTRRKQSVQPLRYAYRNFPNTTPVTPAAHSSARAGRSGSSQAPGTIPPVVGDGNMKLDDIIGTEGVKEITSVGAVRFHAVGDTSGNNGHTQAQEEVAKDMALDYHPTGSGHNPAFFLHLGDVMYGHSKDLNYRDGFYSVYSDYPGKIIAIPGNHDGEIFPGTDPVTLKAFQDNFCGKSPHVPDIASAVGIEREMIGQPGVYWLLDAPFVRIIGLYSNYDEYIGFIGGKDGDATQIQWLGSTLKRIAGNGEKKALIIVTHHPPYSAGGHSGSPGMLKDIDDACNSAGIMYDAFLSGHAHNYQRYTRRGTFNGKAREIPYIVAGGGGRGLQAVPDAYGQVEGQGDNTPIFKSAMESYGYLLVTVTAFRLTIEMWPVPTSNNQPSDTVSVDLQTNQLVQGM